MEVFAEEGVVSFPEINNFSSTMKRESRFFVGMEKSDIQILTDLLEDLNSFLQGADSKSVEKLMRESVKSWLEQTKDSNDFKGLVEEDCLFRLSKVLQEHRIVNFLTRASRRFSKLDEIRNQPYEAQKSNEYELSVEGRNRKNFHSFVDMMPWLMDEAPELSVLSLAGPRGIGKATLARRFYDSEMVQDHFDHRCWVDVSSDYHIPEKLKFIIEEIDPQLHDVEDLNEMRTMKLFGALRKALQPKRYMFVFNDVCEESFWHVIKQALPENGKGSRVIIITSVDRGFNLKPLSEKRSQDLFCRIAFRDEPETRCPRELEPLSREIIRMCRGFPLLILGAAALLSKKDKLLSEWKKFYQNLAAELKKNLQPMGLLDVLAFGWYDLPIHLRPCFLYFSVFSLETVIPNEKLFQLWIAEGFVEEKMGKTQEEIAEEYLNELMLRDLVRPCPSLNGLDQFCKVDRLTHTLARVKADELHFCQMWGDENSSPKRKSNRLSISYTPLISLDNIHSHIHSIFLFNVRLLSFSMASLINKCMLLTVLNLEYSPMKELPEELGNLFHLKYLCLKNTNVREIPKSVQKLQNLQTLDVRNTLVTEIPVEINKLKKLRHLLASDYGNRTRGDSNRGARVKEGIGELENLQYLTTVEAGQSGVGVMKELAELKQLRKLSVSGLTLETASALTTLGGEFSHLTSLTLRALDNDDALNLGSVSFHLPRLQCLVVRCRLQNLPDWIVPLQNLSTLFLSLSGLTEDPLIHVSHLPNLESLWLYRAFEGKELYFEEGGFERLKLLVIRELRGLNALEIEDGALPRLEELRIARTPLKEVPSGIQYLRNLEGLVIYDMPREFVLGMQPNGGSDHWKVEHIGSVYFWYKVPRLGYTFYRIGDLELLDPLESIANITYDDTTLIHEQEMSFCETDDDEEDDNVGQMSFSTIR